MPLARSRGASVCGVFIHARVYQTDVWSHLSYSVKGDSQNFSKNVRASFHPTTVAGRPAPPLPKRTPSRGILRQFLKPGDIFPPGAREQGLQGRVALLQGLQIDLLVVGSAVLPAAEQDANPFESQGPDGGVGRRTTPPTGPWRANSVAHRSRPEQGAAGVRPLRRRGIRVR